MIIENFQVSNIHDCESSQEFNRNVVLNNTTENMLQVEVMPSSMDVFITTTLSPGWNPIIVKAIRNVEANTVQYGW